MQAKEAKTIETMTAGPAPREPFEPTAAIPNAVNIPEPIITPIPSIIRSKALRVFLSPPFWDSSNMVSGLFVVSALISLAVGTSCGTIAAVIPIAVALSQSLGFNPVIVIGATIGGAMFGDNLSLISDTTIASTRTQNVEMRDKMLCNLKIVILPAFLCVLLYMLPVFTGIRANNLDAIVNLETYIKIVSLRFTFYPWCFWYNVMFCFLSE